MPSEFEHLFTLNLLAPHLKGLRPPKAKHDPRGDWRLAYDVYTLGSIRGHGRRMGSLALRRKAAADGGSVLGINYEKRVVPDMVQRVTAELTCRQDELATPVRCTFSSQISDSAGSPVPNTPLEKSAAFEDRQIEITDGPHRRRIAVSPPYTVHWALFEAVGRLPREPFEPIRFNMLDHFDQLKTGQVLSYRQSVEALVGDELLPLHAYDHLGEGIVPWIYWVDEAGR